MLPPPPALNTSYVPLKVANAFLSVQNTNSPVYSVSLAATNSAYVPTFGQIALTVGSKDAVLIGSPPTLN